MSNDFRNPGNVRHYDSLWAILSVDAEGNEGICVIDIPGFGPRVAVTGEPKHFEMLREAAKSAKHEVPKGMKIVAARFNRINWEPL